VTIMPERGKAGATAYRDDERYILSAEYDNFVSDSSDEVGTFADCSGCTCDVYCLQYNAAKYCEDSSGSYKECCSCSNW